jgi:hypothetical protein
MLIKSDFEVAQAVDRVWTTSRRSPPVCRALN